MRIREEGKSLSACLLGLIESFKFDQSTAQIGISAPEVRLKANGLVQLLFGLGVGVSLKEQKAEAEVLTGGIRQQFHRLPARLLGCIQPTSIVQNVAQVGVRPPEVRLTANGLAKLLSASA